MLGDTQDRIDTQADAKQEQTKEPEPVAGADKISQEKTIEQNDRENLDIKKDENMGRLETSKRLESDGLQYIDLEDMSKPINLQHLRAEDLSSKEKIANLVPIYGMLAIKYYDYMMTQDDKF